MSQIVYKGTSNKKVEKKQGAKNKIFFPVISRYTKGMEANFPIVDTSDGRIISSREEFLSLGLETINAYKYNKLPIEDLLIVDNNTKTFIRKNFCYKYQLPSPSSLSDSKDGVYYYNFETDFLYYRSKYIIDHVIDFDYQLIARYLIEYLNGNISCTAKSISSNHPAVVANNLFFLLKKNSLRARYLVSEYLRCYHNTITNNSVYVASNFIKENTKKLLYDPSPNTFSSFCDAFSAILFYESLGKHFKFSNEFLCNENLQINSLCKQYLISENIENTTINNVLVLENPQFRVVDCIVRIQMSKIVLFQEVAGGNNTIQEKIFEKVSFETDKPFGDGIQVFNSLVFTKPSIAKTDKKYHPLKVFDDELGVWIGPKFYPLVSANDIIISLTGNLYDNLLIKIIDTSSSDDKVGGKVGL